MYRICMASDFFHPNIGGVESHIYQLSQRFLRKGHKVIVITHAYDDRVGIRYMTSGLKVYYLPFLVIYNQCTLPTLFTSFPIVRYILIREQINIVHGHSAFSALAHEVMFHAKTLGLKTVFTDHSLFGFADASAIITNKLLKVMLSVCNRVICVSHTGKENTALRAGVDPNRIFVIPHPVDTDVFRPLSTANQIDKSDKLTIVILSRLVYRKGIDLLAGVIPQICRQYPSIKFLIGGEGPKRIVLEEMIERHSLQNRITLVGHVNPDKVRDVMVQGDIFLNCSLTEAFCIAIIEAAACGLQVVSTKVGGVPEVLPEELIWFAEPSVEGVYDGIVRAINDRIQGKIIAPQKSHEMVKSFYQWDDILERITFVYESVESDPIETIDERIQKFWNFDVATGMFFLFITVVCHFLFKLFSYFVPESEIELVPEFDYNELRKTNNNNDDNHNDNKCQ
uniref:phosphatidylinositol N-acetylglucosaminyltransferase n=1 Tax=Dermatophagoides pteronyssinus TaxID=6956 RepID=A0A6P6XWK5_DERPT|nr:phosphatidylinositol N-acetylglucosaminyltransferase subunit A-like [Dermatophagoides pteronyssinus]